MSYLIQQNTNYSGDISTLFQGHCLCLVVFNNSYLEFTRWHYHSKYFFSYINVIYSIYFVLILHVSQIYILSFLLFTYNQSPELLALMVEESIRSHPKTTI